MKPTTCEWIPASKPPRPNALVWATDGSAFFTVLWSKDLGKDGGFGTVRRTPRRVYLHWVEGITHWTLLPDFPVTPLPDQDKPNPNDDDGE